MPNFKIQLNKKANAVVLDLKAEKIGIQYSFATNKSNKNWLDDINNNPNSPQSHLKPSNRDYTIEDLKKQFPMWTKVGLLDADLSFGRCEDKQIVLLAKFVHENKNNIRYVKGAEDLIKRGNIEDKEIIESLLSLDKKPLPLLLRPQKDRRQPLKGGQILAKTWGAGDSEVWLIFGNVKKDRPIFMKDDKFVRDSANNLAKDKDGRAFLLMPLYDFSEDFAEVVTTAAAEMSIREHPNYLLGSLYTNLFGVTNVQELANSFAEFYTKEELIVRLQRQVTRVMQRTQLHYESGIRYAQSPKNKNKFEFVSISGEMERDTSFINALKLALELSSKELAHTTIIQTGNVYA